MLWYLRTKCRDFEVDPYQTSSGPGVIFHVPTDGMGDLCAASLYTLAACNKESHGAIFSRASGEKLNLFYKVYGSDTIRRELATKRPEQIVSSWEPFLQQFRAERQPFLLYQ
jgi:hypothetical protein